MIGADTYTRLDFNAVEALMMSAVGEMASAADVLAMIDTSAQYGESEGRIGEFLMAHPETSGKLYIATKWGLRFDPEDFGIQDYTLQNLLRSVETSASHLTRIDLLYLHTNPAVTARTLREILRGRDAVVDRMRDMKRARFSGITHLGVSVSTQENLDLIVKNPDLMNGFDVLQLNATLLLDRADLARELQRTGFGIVLNSPYRKADKSLRATEDGLRAIYHKILDAHPDAIVLTGTHNPDHLRENIEHVRSWAELALLEMDYSVQDPGPEPATVAGLRSYFAHFVNIGDGGWACSPTGASESAAEVSADALATTIARIMVGSRQTRLGAAPPKRSQDALRERIRYKVSGRSPIEVILTWGPRKFYAQRQDNLVDVAEAAAIERLFDIHLTVQAVYPPGLHLTIFAEDFEGQFIEGATMDAFSGYIESLEALVRVLGIDDTIEVVRTSDLLRRHPERYASVAAQLEENYGKLRGYWLESQASGAEDVECDSLKELGRLGFVGPITQETRRFYLGRLNRFLGDRISEEKKIEMVIRLFACVLMHRQFDLFRINKDVEPVKFSFLPIRGGPSSLMDGRVDLRVVSTDVSKRSMAPWSAKGYLRRRNETILPALKPWREPLGESACLIRAELLLRRGIRTARVRADLLEDARATSVPGD